MQLEEYFEFLSPVAIRVKGTRVGIETKILTEYLENKRTARKIAAHMAVFYPRANLCHAHLLLAQP